MKRDSGQSSNVQMLIGELQREIKVMKYKFDTQSKIRAIHALVITPLQKQIKQILDRWHKNCFDRQRGVRLNIKYLIIKTYKAKLMSAFNGLKAGLTFKLRSGRHGNIDSIHDQNYQMEQDRIELRRQILVVADDVRQQGLKQFRELCVKAAQRNLSQWMTRWQQGADLKSKQLKAAFIILKQMRVRILRTALSNFKRGFTFYRQDQYNFRRADEIRHRLAFRIKKRIYSAMGRYSNRKSMQVLALRYLLKTIHRHQLVRGMLAWQKYLLCTLEQSLLNQEKFQVVIMDRLQSELSTVSDTKNEIDIVNKKFRGALLTGASQTLKKWVIRSHMGGQQYGFVTWKQKTNKLRHRQIMVKYLSRSIEHNMARTVWFRWKQTLSLDNRKNFYSEINQKVIAIGNHEQKLTYNRQDNENQSGQIEVFKSETNSQAALYSQKATKVVTELIKRRHENIFYSRIRYMFKSWRLYSHNQHRCVVALERGISKMCLQRAFQQIRNFHNQDYRNEVLSSHLQNLFRLKLLLPAREALRRWRTNIYQQKISEIDTTTQLTIQETDCQSQRWNQIHKVQLELGLKRTNETLSIKTFKLWKQVYLFDKMQRGRIQGTQEILKTFELRQAIFRLKQRSAITAKYRARLTLFGEKRRQIYLKACFIKSLKYMYEIDKRIANGVAHLHNSVIFSSCLLAFQGIKQHSKIRYEASCEKKVQSARQLNKILERLRRQKVRDAIRLIQQTSNFNLTLYTKLKQCLNNRSSINARSYFDRWRTNTLKQSVVEYNNHEDGPVNLECWHERMACRNLIKMVQKDGNPDQKVQLFLKEQNEKFYELGEKVVTRMMVCQDMNLRLLPIVYDRLKNYAKLRQVWREKITYCNGLLEFDRNNIYLRFQRWKNFELKMKERLNRTPFKKLQSTEDSNQNRLLHLSTECQNKDRAILEFKEQKGVLFKCFISSQKIALANTRSSYERVQQKALARLSDHSNQKLQSEIESVIDRNLNLIQQLKERIQVFEEENQRISIQNDNFRFSAIQAVHNARQVQILKQDNEHLQYEVSNAASAQKNLKSDNQLLCRYLQEHRVGAKIQLEQTQSLEDQKLAELEQLRQVERQRSSSQSRGFISQYKRQIIREPTRSLSPSLLQEPSVSVNNKSPLRLRPTLTSHNV